MEIKDLLDNLSKYDELEAPDGMNIVENEEDNNSKEYNRSLLDERMTDAKHALEDVLGYLKEAGIGDEDDIDALESAITVLTDL